MSQIDSCEVALRNLPLTPSLVETVDKCEMPFDTAAEKMRPTRGERKKFFKIRYRNPFAASSRRHRRRIEGPPARKSTLSAGRGDPKKSGDGDDEG